MISNSYFYNISKFEILKIKYELLCTIYIFLYFESFTLLQPIIILNESHVFPYQQTMGHILFTLRVVTRAQTGEVGSKSFEMSVAKECTSPVRKINIWAS